MSYGEVYTIKFWTNKLWALDNRFGVQVDVSALLFKLPIFIFFWTWNFNRISSIIFSLYYLFHAIHISRAQLMTSTCCQRDSHFPFCPTSQESKPIDDLQSTIDKVHGLLDNESYRAQAPRPSVPRRSSKIRLKSLCESRIGRLGLRATEGVTERSALAYEHICVGCTYYL